MASPTKRSARVGVAPAYRRSDRKARRPQMRFNLQTKPYQIQPFCIMPVLPGESLKSALLQSQVWSDPLAVALKNNGWWCEYFLFYVKHRDMPGFEIGVDGLGKDLIDMFVSNESLAGHVDADGNAATYCPPGGVDYTLNAVNRIVEEYFREEGETAAVAAINGIPLAQIYGKGQADAFQRLTLASAYEDRRVDLDVDGGGDPTVDQLELAYMEWAAARDAGLVDMDYEDWMRTYGGSTGLTTAPDRVDLHKPELLGHIREFTYPTNTVEPTTGVPAVAVGWRVAARMGKAFFFPEPGWIIGLNVIRPKVYLGNQQGSVASMMITRDAWLPAILNDQSNVSHLLVDDLVGPLAATMAEDYWLDLRDLMNNGDQFVNYALGDTDAQFVELPLSTGARRYVTSTDVDQLFAGVTEPVRQIRQDGVLSLMILGRQSAQTQNLVLGRS